MITRSVPTPDGLGSIGIVTHKGRDFPALGEYITETHATAYPAVGGILQSWDGRALGTWRAVASWPLPRTCWMASRMYQIEATIDGRVYTGRGCGVGMVWNGKLKTGGA